jgi:hypothetical protein
MRFVKMDIHSPAAPGQDFLTPLDRIRLSFAFFRFLPQFLIDTSTIRNAPNPRVCNTESRSNRQKVKISLPSPANNRRTYTKVSLHTIPIGGFSRFGACLPLRTHEVLAIPCLAPVPTSSRCSPGHFRLKLPLWCRLKSARMGFR